MEGSGKVMQQESSFTSFRYWATLFIGAVCMPIIFPLMVYKVYQARFRNKVHRDHRLQNKVILITGASSGLGEALAHIFYQAGCKIILSSRRTEELERVKNDLLSLPTRGITHEPAILTLDLAKINEIPGKAQEAVDMFGQIDILINNGGMSYRGEVLNTSVEVDMQLMLVNYFGQIALTKALLPHMISMGGGSIVVVSSIQGKIAIPFRSAYSATKFALQSFFDSLRCELENKNIHICIVSPGYIKTNLSLNALTGSGATYGRMDQTTSSGMDAAFVAQEILQALLNKKDELILSTVLPKVAILIRFLWPRLYFKLMHKRAASERYQNSLQEKSSPSTSGLSR